MFYINYITMHKEHMHAGAIRQLLYGCAFVRDIIHKLLDYPPVHTHKPYDNLHLKQIFFIKSIPFKLEYFVYNYIHGSFIKYTSLSPDTLINTGKRSFLCTVKPVLSGHSSRQNKNLIDKR